MRRRHGIALIVLLVLAGYDFTIRPQRLVESFRAMRCCSEHCQRPSNMNSAERCCKVTQDQAGLRAVDTTSPDVDGPSAVVFPGSIVSLSAPEPSDLVPPWGCDPSRSPPIFLSNSSLLL
jgi:hypothetical protein